MDLWHRARSISRSIRIQRSLSYFERDWKRELVLQFRSYHVDVVFDIGANSGQFATSLRGAAYTGRIVSFEPLSKPFSLLERRAAKDPLWHCRQTAVGDFDGTISINVAGNAGASSSVLPMMKTHEEAFPPANYIGTEDVSIQRLSSLLPEFLQPNDTYFLKIDVQGFEKQVLEGGRSTLDDGCAGMQLELSIVPLYEGGMLIHEALDLAHSMGFTLRGLVPGFTDLRNGKVLQVDGMFFRGDN